MKTIRKNSIGFDIWPGFVDALSALLLVILFTLMVFILAQF
ncbi:MAG: peptidoglycan-binding protein, partial [Alphaproteobacteria bacterium]